MTCGRNACRHRWRCGITVVRPRPRRVASTGPSFVSADKKATATCGLHNRTEHVGQPAGAPHLGVPSLWNHRSLCDTHFRNRVLVRLCPYEKKSPGISAREPQTVRIVAQERTRTPGMVCPPVSGSHHAA